MHSNKKLNRSWNCPASDPISDIMHLKKQTERSAYKSEPIILTPAFFNVKPESLFSITYICCFFNIPLFWFEKMCKENSVDIFSFNFAEHDSRIPDLWEDFKNYIAKGINA